MNEDYGTNKQRTHQGTKDKRGIDIAFLETAKNMIAPDHGAIYSLHKSSTRDFILRKAIEEWKMKESKVLAKIKFELPKTYSFHRKESVDIEVDLIRLAYA